MTPRRPALDTPAPLARPLAAVPILGVVPFASAPLASVPILAVLLLLGCGGEGEQSEPGARDETAAEETAADETAAEETAAAEGTEEEPGTEPEAAAPTPLVEPILTQEERDRLSPDEIVTMLREGNERFAAGEVTVRDHTAQVRAAALGQWPKASVLSCIDSRVPVEDVFDRGIGDVFVARVAGNFENEDILGSLEFASAVAGARVILVLGHEHCGAVKGAIDGAELGHLTAMLDNIQPAIDHFADYEGERTSENAEFVHMVAEQNVRMTVADIRERSETLRELEERGDLRIVGGMYDMETGRVSLID